MKTIIRGKHLKTTFYVDVKTKKDDKGEILYAKCPKIKKETTCDWVDIGEVLEAPLLNSTIWLSETEEVWIISAKLRLDLQATVCETNKVVNDELVNSEEDCKEELMQHIEKYNKQVVATDENVSNYVKIHNIDLSKIENIADVVFLVYPQGNKCVLCGRIESHLFTTSIPTPYGILNVVGSAHGGIIENA
jgi:hypothetical protein